MKKNSLNLKGGVLIIGSLLWQDYRDKPGDDIRKKWRVKRLILKDNIMVKVPIRYGRLSTKTNPPVYTMTFSDSVSKNRLGTGFVVPFRRVISSVEQIRKEAVALSDAEGMEGRFYAGWGSVLGLLVNKNKINADVAAEIIAFWGKEIDACRDFNHIDFKKQRNESPSVRKNGLLNFTWPDPFDKNEPINSFDFLMATATKPTDYPSSADLATNVANDNDRHYFLGNYKSGITTFQDIDVINLL